MKHYKDRHPDHEMPQQLASSLMARYAISGTENITDMTDSLSTASDASNKSAMPLNMSMIQVWIFLSLFMQIYISLSNFYH